MPRRLGREELCREPVRLAEFLLGKLLVHDSPEGRTSGLIVETEAYLGRGDRASRGYGGRRTPSTETLYGPCGRAYVYIVHGHALLNVVAAPPGEPTAVLIRALEPLEGMELMARRRGIDLSSRGGIRRLCSGPGRLTKAMGVTREHDGLDLSGGALWIGDAGREVGEVVRRPRVGVDYAGEDALLPLRFYEAGNPFVSRR